MTLSHKLPGIARWGLWLMAALLVGCASTRPWINSPLPGGVVPPDPDSVQALQATAPEDLSMLMAVTFSGGGARAAAFGYGVLQAMHQTPVRWNGRDIKLLDQVRYVSGVSGGSIIATYYPACANETF